MRGMLVCLASLATGWLAILLSASFGFLWLLIRGEYIGVGPNAWNPTSAFGGHFELGIVTVSLLIFGIGCSIGFLFFSKRLSGANG